MAQTGFGCSSCVQRTGESHTYNLLRQPVSMLLLFPLWGVLLSSCSVVCVCVCVKVLECVALPLNFFFLKTKTHK